MAITELLPWASTVVLLGLLIYFIKNPEKVEKWSSILSRVFSSFSMRAERRAVAGDIQAEIDSFAKSTEKVVPSVLPFGLRIKWIEKEEGEAFIEKDQVVVLMRQHQNNARNLALASFLFMSVGLLPSQRIFVDDDLIQALEVAMTEKFLTSRNRSDALQVFNKDIMGRFAHSNPKIRSLYDLIGDLESKGLFLGILLPELAELSLRFQTVTPVGLKDEVRKFAEFVRALALKKRGEQLETNVFEGKYIRVGFVLVGLWQKIMSQQLEPYLAAISYCIERSINTAYLLAMGDLNLGVTRLVADQSQKMKFGRVKNEKVFTIIDDRGKPLKGIIVAFETFKRTEDVSAIPR